MSNFCWVRLQWPDLTEYDLVLQKDRSHVPLEKLTYLYDVKFIEGGDLSPEEDRLWEAMRKVRLERRRRSKAASRE